MFPNKDSKESKEVLDKVNLINIKREELHSQVRNEKNQLFFEKNRNKSGFQHQSESDSLNLCYGVSNFQKIRRSKALYCDKTEYIEILEKENATSLLFLRPRRFGKSLFLDTLNCFHNELLQNEYEDLFHDLIINDAVKKGKIKANSYMVLKLNFGHLDVSSTYDAFRQSLTDIINDSILRMKKLYLKADKEEEIKINSQNSLSSFQSLCQYVEIMDKKLYILIDEYDTALNQLIIQKNFETSDRLREENEFSLYRCFFAAIKQSLDQCYKIKLFITGVTPLVLDFFLSGFNVDLNITFQKKYSNICGFPIRFIEKYIPSLNYKGKEDLLNIIKENYDGYCFHPDEQERLVNPTLLLYFFNFLKEENKIPEKLMDEKVSSSENSIKFAMKCLNHQNILKKLIIESSIKNEESFLHKLDLNNLQQETSAFIDYLFYIGALTYEQKEEKRFRIPNLLTRSEFIKEIIKISEIVLNEDSIKRFKIAVNVLLEDKLIEPLCKEVQKHKLSHLKFNDVVHSMEQDVKTGFLFALSLAGQKIKSEFIVHNKFADLFLKEHKIHIEFKNIKTKEIIQYSNQESWHELTEISKEIYEMTDEDIMDLKIISFPNDKAKNMRNKGTLNDYFPKKEIKFEKLVKDKWSELKYQTKDNKKLLEESLKTKVISFAILRIGLYKIIFEKIE